MQRQHRGGPQLTSDVLVGAAHAGGRAFLAGWGGHVLLRLVVRHLVPRLLAALRRLRHLRHGGRPRRPQPQLQRQHPEEEEEEGEEHEDDEEEVQEHCLPAVPTQEVEDGRTRDSAAAPEVSAEERDDETDGPSPLTVASMEKGGASKRPDYEGPLADRGTSTLKRLVFSTILHRESLRLGAFLASMTGGFRVIEHALQRVRGRDDGWNPFLAGAIAGFSIAMDSKPRQKAISLYVFFKACGLVWSLLSTRRVLPQSGRWTLLHHIMWCMLCGVMMYCFFCEGELLDSFVYRFLYSCTSHHDQYAMSYVRKHALGMADEEPSAKAQERLDYASGKLRSVPPPVVVKLKEHFQPST